MSVAPRPDLATKHSSLPRVAIDQLDPNPFQPRTRFDETALAELVASIRENGLLQPIAVRPVEGARLQVIAGHRRLEAFRRLYTQAATAEERARFEAIPAHEKADVTDEEMALFALVENLQRDDLSPLDAAQGLLRFQDAHHLSTEALAQRTGLELDRIKRLLRLARAPKVIQDACCHSGILMDKPSGKAGQERARLDLMAALEFAKLHSHLAKDTPKSADDRTIRLVRKALQERWSFRQVRTVCQSSMAEGTARSKAPLPPPLFIDGPELPIRRRRLTLAPVEERSALLTLLKALVAELDPVAA